ncbi:MAG: hypothetical protein KTU85_03895 [Acidimicrobiia bacterium]|nr:hypothetical protein [Acidimicrobiia bacterium]MCY4456476.1 hypothetical protein [Acidimicrobiaceae bacterium]
MVHNRYCTVAALQVASIDRFIAARPEINKRVDVGCAIKVFVCQPDLVTTENATLDLAA